MELTICGKLIEIQAIKIQVSCLFVCVWGGGVVNMTNCLQSVYEYYKGLYGQSVEEVRELALSEIRFIIKQ